MPALEGSPAFKRIVGDAVHFRMLDIASTFEQHERTGKIRGRYADPDGRGELAEMEGEVLPGRNKGIKPSSVLKGFIENPKQLAAAIRRGKLPGRRGRLWRSIRATVQESVIDNEGEAIQEFIDSKEGKKIAGIGLERLRRALVAPHAAVRKCKACAVAHSFAKHTSHGVGSFARIHKGASDHPASWDVL